MRATHSRLVLVVALALALPAALGPIRLARSSSGDGVVEPNGRGLQLLGVREAMLLEQSEQARRAARERALNLYRLLRVAGLERKALANADAPGATRGPTGVGARSIALVTAVLARDVEEARSLRGELDRVRAERSSLASLSVNPCPSGSACLSASASPSALPSFLRPVTGPLLTPFGVGRDVASGAWIFRAAATFAAKPGELTRSPAAARVVRVAGSVAGGVAVVLSVDSSSPSEVPWTIVLSGLVSVAVAPGENVARGALLGTASRGSVAGTPAPIRIEVWRGRSPVDPAAVLR